MINTNALERKWFLYKLKNFLPYAITVTSFTLISLITFILLSPDERRAERTLLAQKEQNSTSIPMVKKEIVPIIQKETIVQNIPKEELEKVVRQVISKEIKTQIPITVAKEEKKITLLRPSLGFLHTHTQEHSTKPVENIEIKTTPKKIKVVQQEKKEVAEKETKPDNSNHGITITKQDAHHEIEEVIKRFKKNKNPALSLFIAKKYYELGSYTKSYNYALATNQLDNNIEDSWLIFAKSLVKLNEKEMAVKMLKKYINHSNSYRASALLNDITLGKFK